MIAIVDYGVGNLASVEKAVETLGGQPRVTSSPAEILEADHVILPGVGAAADAMEKLRSAGLDTVIREAAASGAPFLGICLGMQLMLEESLENGKHPCLGLLKGRVAPFEGPRMDGLRIPHIGWNDIRPVPGTIMYPLDDPYVYFVHSYRADGLEEGVASAWCDYGEQFPCAFQKGNLYGMQFHPEKSGRAGLLLLRRFLETKR